MRLISIALCATLIAPLPAVCAPTEQEVAAARLAYIAGDYNAALNVIRDAADAGNATALNILGAAHEDGRGVAKDATKALALFEQAAKAGEVRGWYNIGTMFVFGSGEIPEDRARAKREFMLAAAAGYAPAMTALGQLRERAEPPDYEKAAEWYEKAHKGGDVIATANLAHAYVKGQGRNEDWLRARVLYTEAAARGLPRAYNDLGVMHEHGYGVHADLLTAFSFYKRSAELGYAKGAINLAKASTKARFPFMSKDAALGYCYWGMRAASAFDRERFEQDCQRVEERLEPDATLRAKAQAFADSLESQ